MSKEIRSLAARYPFEVRYRARELYLRGVSLQEIGEVLGKELDERDAKEALAKGEPAPPPVDRVPYSVLKYWYEQGTWSHDRKTTERFLMREQLRRIKTDFARRLEEQRKGLRLNRQFVERYFYKQLADEAGTALFHHDGSPILVLKDPGDAGADMEMADVVKLHLQGVKLDIEHMKAMSEMAGDFLPKASITDLIVAEPEAPPPARRLPAPPPAPAAPAAPPPPPPVAKPAPKAEPSAAPPKKKTRKPPVAKPVPGPVEPPPKKTRRKKTDAT